MREPADTAHGLGVPDDYAADIARLVEYWHRIHPSDRLPGRQHLDPADIPALLPHVWLTDVFRDPWRFRMRLVGTAVVNYVGRDGTGHWVTDLFPEFEESDAFRDMVRCCVEKVPVFRTAKRLGVDGPRLSQRVHLPLAGDGETVDILLSLTRFVIVPEDDA